MRERTTRDCVHCGANYSCVWVDDAWVCRRERCQAEFYPHDEVDDMYAAPETAEGRLVGMEYFDRVTAPIELTPEAEAALAELIRPGSDDVA